MIRIKILNCLKKQITITPINFESINKKNNPLLLTKNMSNDTPLANMPIIALRLDLINGQFDLEPETTDAMRAARAILAKAGRDVIAVMPKHADIGRTIAFLDMLQAAKDTVCVAAIIGDETKNRAGQRKRKERIDDADANAQSKTPAPVSQPPAAAAAAAAAATN